MDGELIKIEKGEIAPGQIVDMTSARLLWEGLEVVKDFATWIKVQIRRCKLIEGKHFCYFGETSLPGEVSKGGRGKKVDNIGLNAFAAEHIAMMCGTEQGEIVREKFRQSRDELVQLKKESVDPSTMLANPAYLRELLLGYTEKVEKLETKVAEQAPMVKALDLIATASEGAMSLTAAAKTLQMHRVDLINRLLTMRWIYRAARGRLQGMQTHMNRGLLEHKLWTPDAADPEQESKSQVLVTSRGLAELSKIFAKTNGELPFE